MFTFKKEQKKLTKATLILASLSLTLNFILAIVIYADRQLSNVIDDSQTQNLVDNNYYTARITFCYDNNIRPCDHDQISAWNAVHPDDMFRLTAPKLSN